MLQELWQHWEKVDSKSLGTVDLQAVCGIMGRFGLSVLADAGEELISEVGIKSSSPLDFDAVLRLMEACRKAHGFSRSERADFSAIFEKFDYDGSGELSNVEVMDLLRYMGCTMSMDTVSAMIRIVDFNENGSMDSEEFLRLMRLMREEDITAARTVLRKLCGASDELPASMIKEAFAALQLFPEDDVARELFADLPASVPFSEFMRLLDRCRFRTNLDFRKHAGFAGDMFLELAAVWNRGGPKRTFAKMSELIWLFSDSQVRVNTTQGRSQLLDRVRKARQSALSQGATEEEVGREGSDDVSFFTFLHLLRSIVRDSEQESVQHEREAISASSFSSAEVTEFRRIFFEMVASDEQAKRALSWQQLLNRRSGVGGLLAQLTAPSAVTETAILELLRNIGLQVSVTKMTELNSFLDSVRTTDEDSELRFATFLRLMRWMLDRNFANICGVMGVHGGQDLVQGAGHNTMSQRHPQSRRGAVVIHP
jgi:Ca2+-binding EF-hand superfamily protein